jgi:uncharacterized protein YbjT (DUF2867 family)
MYVFFATAVNKNARVFIATDYANYTDQFSRKLHNMIVMVGASGQVGTPTIGHLVRKGARIRALTSNPASAERLRGLGVAETVVGDFRNDDDLRRVMDDAATVFHVCPRFTEDEPEIGKRVIAAARANSVSHFVYISVFHPQLHGLVHHWGKLKVEEAVIESGMPFNIIQPSIFMQNIKTGFQASWQTIRDDGVYAVPFSPHRKIRLIDTEDLGEAIANVLTEPRLRGATFELGGPDSLTLAEMAAIIGEELGRKVNVVALNDDERNTLAEKQGKTAYAVDGWLRMWRHYDEHGFPGGNPTVLASLLGHSPTGYRDFIKRLIAEDKSANSVR